MKQSAAGIVTTFLIIVTLLSSGQEINGQDKLFPEDQCKEMDHNADGTWTAVIELPDHAAFVDFFSTHGKLVRRKSEACQTYLSSPYTRVKLKYPL